jgi:F-type H+-transporting ATPase subunit gamma
MASSKEIRGKISGIKNTQKITSAMQMVAASKMRKAQDRMYRSRPYAKRIRQVISHIANGHPEYRHAFLEEREIKRVGYIIVSSDRGLCGGLNINLFKKALTSLKAWHNKEVEIDLCLIGVKAEHFFKRIGGKVVANATHLGETPSVVDLIGVVKVMLDAYRNGTIDALFIVANSFVNTMSQVPHVNQLLPIVHAEAEESEVGHWDYIYEPDDAKKILDSLLDRYIESQVYQNVIENIACEQASRMVAMKNATDNAGKVIKDLKQAYNKARQAAITQELAEIVAGAAAV